jgi:hypothetical protein
MTNTWNNCRDGIKSNLSKLASRKGWEEIKRRAPENFQELRYSKIPDFCNGSYTVQLNP